MLADQLAAAVAEARSHRQLDELARLLWRGLSEGHVSDAAAEAISGAVEARRLRFKGNVALSRPKAVSEPRRPVSRDKLKSLQRRRQLAMSGAIPSRLAAGFTLSEIAVMTVVAREVQRRGKCEMPLGKIAALAGVCRTVAQNALRQARRLGLVAVQERRRAGWRSDTNVITVTSRDWAAWLRLGGRVQEAEHHVVPRVILRSNSVEEVQTAGDARLRSLSVPSILSAPNREVRNGAYQRGVHLQRP